MVLHLETNRLFSRDGGEHVSLGWVEGETGRGWGRKVTECLVESFLLIPIESMGMRNTREVDVCLFNAVLDYGEYCKKKNVMDSFVLFIF